MKLRDEADGDRWWSSGAAPPEAELGGGRGTEERLGGRCGVQCLNQHHRRWNHVHPGDSQGPWRGPGARADRDRGSSGGCLRGVHDEIHAFRTVDDLRRPDGRVFRLAWICRRSDLRHDYQPRLFDNLSDYYG